MGRGFTWQWDAVFCNEDTWPGFFQRTEVILGIDLVELLGGTDLAPAYEVYMHWARVVERDISNHEFVHVGAPLHANAARHFFGDLLEGALQQNWPGLGRCPSHVGGG